MVIPAVVVSNTCSYWPAKRDTSVEVPAFKYIIAKWAEFAGCNKGQSNLRDINVVRLYNIVLTSSHTKYGEGNFPGQEPITQALQSQLRKRQQLEKNMNIRGRIEKICHLTFISHGSPAISRITVTFPQSSFPGLLYIISLSSSNSEAGMALISECKALGGDRTSWSALNVPTLNDVPLQKRQVTYLYVPPMSKPITGRSVSLWYAVMA